MSRSHTPKCGCGCGRGCWVCGDAGEARRVREDDAAIADALLLQDELMVEDNDLPASFLVDDETFDRMTDAIQNPRPPNDVLKALFRKSGVGSRIGCTRLSASPAALAMARSRMPRPRR